MYVDLLLSGHEEQAAFRERKATAERAHKTLDALDRVRREALPTPPQPRTAAEDRALGRAAMEYLQRVSSDRAEVVKAIARLTNAPEDERVAAAGEVLEALRRGVAVFRHHEDALRHFEALESDDLSPKARAEHERRGVEHVLLLVLALDRANLIAS